MDRMILPEKCKEILQKIKYPALIVLIGLMLILIPEKSKTEVLIQEPNAYIDSVSVQDQLEQILSRIDGAGEVRVLLTERRGTETVYQTDIRTNENDTISEQQTDTVIVSSGSGTDEGLIRRIDSPVYQGAIIVCQGADNANVRRSASLSWTDIFEESGVLKKPNGEIENCATPS